MLVLYQLAISHYCEKIRWALDHKRLPHRTATLLPGLHVAKMKRKGLKSSLPVLEHDGTLVQNSSDIIDYLDAAFPERSLTPTDPSLAAAARAWEKTADDEIGPHVRRICYHHLLQHPDVVIPMLAHGGPWYGGFLLRRMFPKLEALMRQGMQIDAAAAAASARSLDAALAQLLERLQGREFLVGDEFTRADLAAASLLAPFRMPDKYGITWPRPFPASLAAVADAYAERLAWVDRMYAQHR